MKQALKPSQPKPLLKSEEQRLLQLVKFEKQAEAKGFRLVAGVDEAGRGPLAGPVVAAACFLKNPQLFYGINDSKLLSPPKRKRLFEELSQHPDLKYGIGIIDSTQIDQINIYQASLEAMRRAVLALPEQPDYLLIDGKAQLRMVNITEEVIVGGDRSSQLIAAASILAKETRDSIMIQYHLQYPEYGFDKHKGYGTADHLEALQKYGPCPIHRRSFAPVREESLHLQPEVGHP